MEQLEASHRQGISISPHLFDLALQSVTNNTACTLDHVHSRRLVVSAARPPLVARTAGQVRYLEALDQNDVAFGIGPAGTGKTYLAMGKALALLREQAVQRIVLTRPAVEAGEALGFLPGDLKEKIFPYLRPLYDALYDMLTPEEVERHVQRGLIEIAPLAYMRGRTLNHACVILDEAQNTTCEQMFMLLTRLGADSKCFVTGDISQVDLKPSARSGLAEAMETLIDVEGVAFHFFHNSDVIRHPVVQRIVDAYNRKRGDKPLPSSGR
jgi:phosphate starvation-inducible PhoH-like protein